MGPRLIVLIMVFREGAEPIKMVTNDRASTIEQECITNMFSCIFLMTKNMDLIAAMVEAD